MTTDHPQKKRRERKKGVSERLPAAFSADYETMLNGIIGLIEQARRSTVRSINALMSATYWTIGRCIVEFEQGGESRAQYGAQVMELLASDLTSRFGRGFSATNLRHMRAFFLAYPSSVDHDTIQQTLSAESSFIIISKAFPMSWSHYVRLLPIDKREVRSFYEKEALRGGWSVRQLERQISTKFYERTLLSKKKAAMLAKGSRPQPGEVPSIEQEIKDPYVLEFLDLKDEYSESMLEEALIRHLETFLLELGNDFAFIGRQRRLRIGNEWYRVDLLFFHRRLRCLVIIDLKVGTFSHADAGQMHMYLNYARKNWTHADENPPVGLILCAQKDEAVVQYALEGLPNQVIAAEYRMVLPDEAVLAAELERTHKLLEQRKK